MRITSSIGAATLAAGLLILQPLTQASGHVSPPSATSSISASGAVLHSPGRLALGGTLDAARRTRDAGSGKREANWKREAYGSAQAARRGQQRAAGAPVSSYRIVKIYPHDRTAFTQGLVYLDGVLYEGTGLNGQSGIRKVRLENGEVLQQEKLHEKYFGEGIAVWRKSIIQITWQSEIGFVYDLATFKPVRSFGYTGEGWGLTHDGTRLIMSDGSASLRFLDPETLRETGRLEVREGTTPVKELNELEFVKGEILANVWRTNRLARISPRTGQVTGWIDLSGLLDPRDAKDVDVLNGVAYDAGADRLFVTGKLWPKLFEIRIVPPGGPPARSGR